MLMYSFNPILSVIALKYFNGSRLRHTAIRMFEGISLESDGSLASNRSLSSDLRLGPL
jgi:hypothetical protein